MTALEVSLSMAERGDATAARALEDALAEAGRDVQDRYASALIQQINGSGSAPVWNIRRVTPAQIAAAYREAMKHD